MNTVPFDKYFQGQGLRFLRASIALALEEDGPDSTALGVFTPQSLLCASIIAKQDTLVVGLPLMPLIFEAYNAQAYGHTPAQMQVEEGLSISSLSPLNVQVQMQAHEGAWVHCGTEVARLHGKAIDILTVERTLLNYITHLSGIANLVRMYVDALAGTDVLLLDTRKTLPGLRWPEKYAVRMGGGHNHRMNLTDMLMLKDTHLDAIDGIAPAVARLRTAYAPCPPLTVQDCKGAVSSLSPSSPCPPIVVECRTLAEVDQAVTAQADRILLDNMDIRALALALPRIPAHIEAEVSGGVTLENIRALALASERRPDYISVGRIIHSAPAADFSMRIRNNEQY